MKRANLPSERLLPDVAHNNHLFYAAVTYVMNFMMSKLGCLQHFKPCIACKRASGSMAKTEVVPLEMLDIDEALTDNNIRTLERFCRDTHKEQPIP